LERDAVKRGRYVLIALLAVAAAIFFGTAGSAHASHFKYTPHQHYWFKKKSSTFGRRRHAPKRLKDSKSTFRSPVTGNTLYGKPVKPK
jgi:hypothetical protein